MLGVGRRCGRGSSPRRAAVEDPEDPPALHTTDMKILLAKVALGLVPLAGLVMMFRSC